MNGTCTNTEGSYESACNIVYSDDGKICEDVNECLDNPCDVNGACANPENVSTHSICASTDGSFVITCSTGFQMADDQR